MRFLRRIFAESTVAIGLVAIALAVTLVVTGESLAWLGAALAWLPIVGYLIFLLVGKPSTTARHLWALYVVAGIGVAIAIFAGPLAVLVALGGVGGAAAYAYWYSRQHVPAVAIAVGAKLPPFPIVNLDGSSTTSTDAFATGAKVIMFYRGNWCPFCMVQVQQIAAQYRELEQRGVGVALISPQRADETAELASRFEIPVEFYVDRDGAAAAALDLTQAGGVPTIFGAGTNGDTVVPTVVITDRKGVVIWVAHSDNHRVRPEPATFLDVLDRAGITAPA